MVNQLELVPLWTITLLFAFALFLGMYVGSRLRVFVATDPAAVSSGQLIFGTMSILSLLIGFTFSLALNRHDMRRDLLIEEANAIRSMHRSLAQVEEPRRTVIGSSLAVYAKGRLAFAQSNLIEQRALAPRLLAERENFDKVITEVAPISSTGVNQAQLLAGATRLLDTGMRMDIIAIAHVPPRVIILLVVLSSGSAVMIGISIGQKWRTLMIPMAIWSAILSMALFTIVDLDSPQWGSIRLDSAPMVAAVKVLTETERSSDKR